MNRATLFSANGTIDPDKVPRDRRASPAAEVTLREYHARTGRHTVLFEGRMSFQHLSRFAAGKSALEGD